MIEIISHEISPQIFSQNLLDSSCGGVVCFEGRVRNHNEGKKVSRLFYECYLPMASKVMNEIAEQAKKKWEVKKVDVVHRIGKIPMGEIAVWVGVSAAHRSEAFVACQFVIDEIKKKVPIWKKETYEDGSETWVACHHA